MAITPRDPDIGAIWGTLLALCTDINNEIGSTYLPPITTGTVIDPTVNGSYTITKGSAAALTLAAPTKDGVRISLYSTTAFAHTVTATGLLQTASAAVNVATFAAFAGAQLHLRSFNGKWIASGSGITFT